MAATVNPAASSTIAPAQLQIFDRNQEESPLLRLPAELRNQIWEYVFTGSEFWVKRFRSFFESHMCCPPHPTMGVLYTCRQMYQETALLPAQLSVFAIGLPERSIEELNDLSYKVPHPFQMVTDRMTEQQVGAVRVVYINLQNHLDEFFVCEIELLKEQSKGSSNRFDVFPLARLTGLKHVGVRLVDPYFSPWDPMCLQKEPMKASVKRTVKNMGVHKDVQISVDLGRQYTPHERLPS
ncbi:hypothetical protein HBI24_158760 [Parastagonospora nodorum]|nr:hypothetical protein HBI09_150170 [Parastagonospora nodorum]KAH4056929.1 hypothetical protein HBH49_039240 [Parastagonospora nodorum]KAH4110556.1 hypothetical protein HBH46_021930 [Parastagonospora nodorum]KAH4197396.1 hypothetical protein HBH42_056570 [Parastagonospora nodorum]KAH4807779.1 hypothetical protein HBH61_126790 [Parastagonospora nodorum]